MTAQQTNQQASQVWVWCPVANNDKGFRHPSEVPVANEEATKSCFSDNLKGLRTPARLRQAQLLQITNQQALIAEDGTTREVPKGLVLPWFEGLMLLSELEEKKEKPAWWDTDLETLLRQERAKYRHDRFPVADYVEKRMLKNAVTGALFVDTAGTKWSFRRERISVDEEAEITGGEEGDGFFKIKDVLAYLPPWEALCHEKCGFYQDFYQVRWEYPFSEIDYHMIENGCADVKGSTWEPDECLPAHLDVLRLGAKKVWIKRRREQEQRMADEGLLAAKRAREQQSEGNTSLKRLKSEDDQTKRPVKLSKLRRDGTPLQRDVFRSMHGHDFVPPKDEKALGEIRSGWPKAADEYPKGYGVANPPGYCGPKCDCMDDQRPQHAWETTKAWLEDSHRSRSTVSAINLFGEQARFTRRRGQVSKMCYFEALSSAPNRQPHAEASLKLVDEIAASIASVLKRIPMHSLKAESHPVRVPARALIHAAAPRQEDRDYDPLGSRATLAKGGPLPEWLSLHPDDARLYTSHPPVSGVDEVSIHLEFLYAEGPLGPYSISVTPESLGGPTAPWALATGRIVSLFNSETQQLHASARAVLREHFGEVYDFQRGAPKDKALGEWIEVMVKLFRMTRSSAVANILVTSAHKPPMQPRAPVTPTR